MEEQRKLVTVEESASYMELVKEVAGKIAGGVALCILSPVALLLLGAASEYGQLGISENMAGGIGICILLGMVAFAVVLFILNGMRLGRYEYLEKEPITLESGIREIVTQKKQNYEERFYHRIAAGVVLCILSVVPLILAGCFTDNDFYAVCGVCVLLAFVAMGVGILIPAGMVWSSYEKLLEEGEYSADQKEKGKRIEGFAGIYWCVITAIYLAYSFYTKDWQMSWIIWPVAGVLFGAIAGIIRVIHK